MAYVDSIIFGTQDISVLNLNNVDLWTSEKAEISVRTTKYPIEDGSSVTDNAYREPIKISLSGFVSNIQFLGDSVGVPNLVGYRSTQKVKNVWQQIETLASERELLTIVTTFASYSNMLLTKVSTDDVNFRSGTSMGFTLDFEEIKIVGTQTTSLPPIKVGGDDNPAQNMTSIINGGVRDSQAVAKTEKVTSLLKKITGF
jgi:hypothetical protein